MVSHNRSSEVIRVKRRLAAKAAQGAVGGLGSLLS